MSDEDPSARRRALHAVPPPASNGLWLAFRRLGPLALFGLIPLALAAVFLGAAVFNHVLGFDFHEAFWPAGRALLDGQSPYPPVDASVISRRTSFVYPPIVAIALAPVALLPLWLATLLAVVATVAALAGTLWVLGVRDLRCYGVALASAPVLNCIQTASMTALFAFAIALAWRWRARGLAMPLLICAVIVAKLFLWPLLLWLLLVRGFRTAVAAGVGVVVIVLAPWAFGFPGFSQYPRLLLMLTDVEGPDAITPRALVLSAGGGARLAEVLTLAVGGCVLAVAGAEVYRHGSQLRVLSLTLLAALLLSPIVWPNYFVVLLPVIALASPRLGWPWFVFLALWLGGGAPDASGGAHQILLGLAVIFAAVWAGVSVPRMRAAPGLPAALPG